MQWRRRVPVSHAGISSSSRNFREIRFIFLKCSWGRCKSQESSPIFSTLRIICEAVFGILLLPQDGCIIPTHVSCTHLLPKHMIHLAVNSAAYPSISCVFVIKVFWRFHCLEQAGINYNNFVVFILIWDMELFFQAYWD
jgi:hypothetical protein